MENQPVVFVAVNSGNSSSSVESYLDRVNVKWPAIVDKNRKFEAACGVGEISLRNIWQTAIITPEGRLRHGAVTKIDYFLKQAKWNIDPTGMPHDLRPAWRALEFGDLPGCVKLIKPARKFFDPTNAAVQRLKNVIDPRLNARFSAAEKLDKDDRFTEANAAYRSILRDFDGYPHEAVSKATVALQRILPWVLRDLIEDLDQSEEPTYQIVHSTMERVLRTRIRDADILFSKAQYWEATKAYERLLFHFGELDTPALKDLKTALRNIKKRGEVKPQLAARRSLERALKNLKSDDPKKQKSGKAALVKLRDKYPGTEAADEATNILSK